MRRKAGQLILLICLLLVLSVFLSAAGQEAIPDMAAPDKAGSVDLDAVSASIDGEDFTVRQFISHAVFLRYQYLENYARQAENFIAYGLPLDPLNLRFEDLLGENGREDLTEEALDQLIYASILEMEGRAAGISFPDTEIESEIREILGISAEEDLHRQIEERYHGNISAEFAEQIASARLTESALFEKALQDHRFEEEMVDLRHIVVEEETAARDILEKLRAGEDWNELAAAFSLDTYTRDTAGSLGWVRRSDIMEELAEAAFALEPDTISDPVQTPFGFHILSSTGKEMRPLEGEALEEAQQLFYEEWGNDLLSKHTIRTDPALCAEALPPEPEFVPIISDPEDTVIPPVSPVPSQEDRSED